MQFPHLSADEVQALIERTLREDIGEGDHTSLACLPSGTQGKAELIAKAPGVIAGVELSRQIFHTVDTGIKWQANVVDGAAVQSGDRILTVSGPAASLLSAERLVLNFMQRLSGIATTTRAMVDVLAGTPVQVLDTRKTTPGLRALEKWAVHIGGGVNHRFGLDDMFLIKDNHIDFCGGVIQAIDRVLAYRDAKRLNLKIVVEARTLEEVSAIAGYGYVDRILLDNFPIPILKEAVSLIAGRMPSEASGNIGLHNVREYRDTGVDFVSSGSLTHSVVCLDLSLKTLV
ncbi:MAG: carboxylating nicotinate-nucleotide diphosphorylase [Flavobacteriales bacterium]|nr:carboxylating nicotinate-nucleotide diphosphorylase [Flavobacteriales bacterium]MCB9446978.1 carboxylating nicotinate-nucleotide diphosphorylase [Flavobacteriales bacterium]